MTGEFVHLRACVDCALFVANGEASEGYDADAMLDRWPDHWLGYGWGDDDPDLGFSPLPCECCGSPLGGDRVKLHAQARDRT